MAVCLKCGKYSVGDHESCDHGEEGATAQAANTIGTSAPEEDKIRLEEIAA